MKASEVIRILDRLNHLQHAYLREFSYGVGLNLRQLECLIYFQRCNRYSDTPLALAEYLGLTKGTVSQTILSLEEKLLLKKRGDTSDGRIVHLTLTRKAEKLLKQLTDGSPIEKALSENHTMSQSLGKMLLDVLRSVQKANKAKIFSACYSCDYFLRNEFGSDHKCGLTKEPLTEHESLKICREHTSN